MKEVYFGVRGEPVEDEDLICLKCNKALINMFRRLTLITGYIENEFTEDNLVFRGGIRCYICYDCEDKFLKG